MKTLLCLTLALSALASPALTFAQTTSAPLTRAQVVADLVRLEKAGYNQNLGGDPNYPADIQVAEATVAAEDAQANAQPTQDAVGGASATGSSASGAPVDPTKPAPCTGPASFCNTFFGS